MKNLIKEYWAKLGMVLLLSFLIASYIVGIFFQFSKVYNKTISSSGSDFFTEGVKINFSEIYFSPVRNFDYLLSNKLAWPIVIIAFIFLAGFSIRIFSQFVDKGFMDKRRGFKYSKSGSYGTAGWLTEGDLDGIAKISTWRMAEGHILGQLDKTGRNLVTTDPNSWLNKHVAVFGASGTGKSRCYSRNCFIQAVKNRESVIVTDPKGELFEDTAQFFRNNGYVVKIFNLVNPEKSDSWNCLKEIKGNEIIAQVFADTVIRNTIIGAGKSDHFWDNSEMNLLKALILRVERGEIFKKLNKQNMGTVYELLTKASGESGLDELFNPRNLTPDEKCCIAPYNIFKQAAENIRGSIILGLGTRLQVFQNEVIKKITEYDDIDLSLPGKHPCAYFCIMSDQDSSLNFLSSLFFSFLFIDLVRYADLNGGKCDVNVNFILDEFPNIGQIVDFTKKISTVRSRGINISVIFQAISQLENRYPNGMWQEILGNCDTHLFLGCNDPKTAQFISDRAGEVTIKVGSSTLSKNSKLSLLAKRGVRESEGEGKRKLLTVDEVMRTPIDECLIVFRSQNALRAYKYDYSNHPRSKEFIKTYIRDYPSIFEKEKIYNEQTFKIEETTIIDNQHIKNNTDYNIKEEISDIEKLKDDITNNPQYQNNNKPKKDIFLKNTNQDTSIDDIKTNDIVNEVFLEGEIIDEVIKEPVSTKDENEPHIINNDEGNICEQFDNTEIMLHNIEDSSDTNSNNQNQNNEDILNAILSGESKIVKSNKVDPIFGKDFFTSIAKTWKPGDIGKKTKERLKKQAKDSSVKIVDEVNKQTNNGLLLTKKSKI